MHAVYLALTPFKTAVDLIRNRQVTAPNSSGCEQAISLGVNTFAKVSTYLPATCINGQLQFSEQRGCQLVKLSSGKLGNNGLATFS